MKNMSQNIFSFKKRLFIKITDPQFIRKANTLEDDNKILKNFYIAFLCQIMTLSKDPSKC